MFSFIKGQIMNISANEVLVQAGNLGFFVFVDLSFLEKYTVGQEVGLYTYVQLNDNHFRIFGFDKLDRFYFFKKLLTVKGIGPKTALSILSAASLQDLQEAISQNDPAILKQVAGIGSKTAERIVLELKNKIGKIVLSESSSAAMNNKQELEQVLQNFGYTKVQIKSVIDKIPPASDLADQLKFALKNIK